MPGSRDGGGPLGRDPFGPAPFTPGPLGRNDCADPWKRRPQASLVYYIFEGLLVGFIGTKLVHVAAMSGGAGGSTKHRPTDVANNPYMEGLKTVSGKAGHTHGGPIPPGRYTIAEPARHPHLGLSAALIAYCPTMGRGGFYIHGRGPHGSDGCIVPLEKSQFDKLMSALEASKGGSLWVQETMGDERFA